MPTGRIIAGRYRFVKRIGRGSFGVVWRAEELLGGTAVSEVAVKVFSAELNRSEIALLASVSHPNILAYRAVVEDSDDICLVTELADQGDAASRLHEWPDGLAPDEVRRVLLAVAEALLYLHGIGWIHRDVKPANILFVRGVPKLGDVGTARALSESSRNTTTASLGYAAPELFSSITTAAGDVYALGCTAFELLTGRLPFEGSTTELVHKHMHEPVSLPSGIPADLGALIVGCLEKAPSRRWSIQRVIEALRSSTGADSTVKAPAPSQSESPRASPTKPETPSAPPPSSPFRRPAAPPPAVADAPPTGASSPPPQTNVPPPPVAPKAVPGSAPTPLDPALRRHLARFGRSWGEPLQWKSFMAVAGPIAREHKIGERALIGRAEHLLPEVEAAVAAARGNIGRVRQWVLSLGSNRWSAQRWAAFLDGMAGADEYELADIRDALLIRFYPPAAGATRSLDLGHGRQHLLVYRPIASVVNPTTRIAGLLFKEEKAKEHLVGIWTSAQPITGGEWAEVTQSSLPPGVDPDRAAMAGKDAAMAFLRAARRRWPGEEFRWPQLAEYDGIKAARQPASALPKRLARRPARSSSLTGQLIEHLATSAAQAVKQMQEAWLDDEELAALNVEGKTGLMMNLVSGVPRSA